MLLRTVLDPVTGDLSDTRTRYLGSRPVKLFRVRMQGQEAVSNERGQAACLDVSESENVNPPGVSFTFVSPAYG